jgi:DNA primase
MPYYSDDIIEEVRSRNDIVDVISQYVRLSKKGDAQKAAPTMRWEAVNP